MNNINLNPKEIAKDILDAVKGVIDGDVPELRDFARTQLEAIAEQTVLVAKGLAVGWIDTEEEKAHWAKTLKDMTTEFVKTLRALVMLTLEKAINAVLGVLNKVFETAVNAVLPF
jgi:hypothetical protein